MCWQKYMVSSYSYSNIQLLVVHSLVAILCHNTQLPLLTCSICFVSIYICVHICIHRYVHSLHLPIYRSCCRVSKIGKMVCVWGASKSLYWHGWSWTSSNLEDRRTQLRVTIALFAIYSSIKSPPNVKRYIKRLYQTDYIFVSYYCTKFYTKYIQSHVYL